MSSFNCEKCGKPILDAPNTGYYTECEHYPLEEKNILSPNARGRISHKKLDEIKKNMMMEEAIASATLADNEPEWEARKRCEEKPFEQEKTDYTKEIMDLQKEEYLSEGAIEQEIPEVIRKFREEFDIKVWCGYYDMEHVEQFILEALSARNRKIKEWAESMRVKITNLPDDGTDDTIKFTVAYNQALEDLIKFLQ
ncbi:MAG: hypothetical protein WCY09_09185 [Candidatus Omnitrophota bacterium]|jgi:hypothetical protein